MWPLKRKHPNIPETIESSWALFKGEWEGKPLIARVNSALKRFSGHPQYPHQVGVAVPFRSPDENGFPPPDESAELAEIEEMLCSKLETQNESLFAAVITTAGMREFVFYTSNPKSVESKLRELEQTVRSHQIQRMIRSDEDWGVYRQFV
jgi:hypothetical protein